MAEEKKTSSWQTTVTLIGLAISLFGNWIQYRSLDQKKAELLQAERTLNATEAAKEDRRHAIDAQLLQLKFQMEQLDAELKDAELDTSNVAMGIALDRKDVTSPTAVQGNRAVQSGLAREGQLKEQKQKLQDKIDAAIASKAGCS